MKNFHKIILIIILSSNYSWCYREMSSEEWFNQEFQTNLKCVAESGLQYFRLFDHSHEFYADFEFANGSHPIPRRFFHLENNKKDLDLLLKDQSHATKKFFWFSRKKCRCVIQ